jgi:hypothetical protein
MEYSICASSEMYETRWVKDLSPALPAALQKRFMKDQGVGKDRANWGRKVAQGGQGDDGGDVRASALQTSCCALWIVQGVRSRSA